MEREWIERVLGCPMPAIAYAMSRQLAEAFGEERLIETKDRFDVAGFARAGGCAWKAREGIHSQFDTGFHGPAQGFTRRPETAWLEITFEGEKLDFVTMRWREHGETQRWAWIVGDGPTARRFHAACAEWSAQVHGEILVFQDGCFSKSSRLHEEIKATRWDDLVLRGAMREDIANDFEAFFRARDAYEKNGAPWRRGALFLGPPGNGKTHCVKALVNRLEKPTLYVRGFRHKYRTEADCIGEVFERARQIAPCVLVLEDIDGLFDAEGLAFFLNELDGFASNSGLVTLATTNHAERLDPALLDRPSRFDRTYAFELPSADERRRFLARQSDRLAAGGLPPAALDELAAATADFSFAYLKELHVGALLAVASGQEASYGGAVRKHLERLREQLGRARAVAAGSRPIA